MIGTQTPFRISFAGGGSDLPAFYREEPGSVLSVTINKYVYILIHDFFDHHFQIKYSRTELADRVEDIQHPLVREALKEFDGIQGIDINSIADIPAGTGMGSSSAFTVGLLHALYAYRGEYPSKNHLADLACRIEIDRAGSPIGKQDQYSASFGGMNFISFMPDDTVQVHPLYLPQPMLEELEANLLLFYLGKRRNCNDLLAGQQKNLMDDKDVFRNQRRMVELSKQLYESLKKQSLDDFGQILHEGWCLKKSLSKSISNGDIDDIYDRALKAGAKGGKLLGAGGSGFLLVYCDRFKQRALRDALSDLREFRFGFDYCGSKVFYVGNNHST